MDIQLQVNGQPVDAALALPAGGKGPGVLVLHAWWGLKPFFKNLCARLAEQGFVALAPDLNKGEIAWTVEDATALMQSRDDQFTGDVVMTAEDFLRAHPACTSQKIGVVGFSMGADWALITASNAPDQVSAVVLFYGGFEMDFKKIQAKVLGHFSDIDEWVPINDIRSMENGLRAAGVDVTTHLYPGLPHWFVEDDRLEYNSTAAELAWSRTFDFLHENVK